MSTQEEVRKEFREPFKQIRRALMDLKMLGEYYPHPKIPPKVLEFNEKVSEFQAWVEREIET